MLKRLISFILILIFCVSLPFSAFARAIITDASLVDASAFTPLAPLQSKWQEVFRGQIDLYTDKALSQKLSLPLGVSMSISDTYFVPSGKGVVTGKQCFIYANAVYHALFGEAVGRGENLSYSEILLAGGNELSYEKMKALGIQSGAYIRTTEKSDASYDSNSGHSMLVLSFDAESITVLEGNADNKGLIRITIDSWADFNRTKLKGKGRYLCHIIQPTLERLQALYGTSDLTCTAGHTVKPEWKTTKLPTVKTTGQAQVICGECGEVVATKELSPYVDTAQLFEDISERDWFYKNDAVNFAYSNGIFYGMSDTRFEPNTKLTRGMLVSVLGRMRGVESTGTRKTKFTDVKKSAYYAPYVAWASKEGLVAGFEDGTFRPDEDVTREQLCKVIALYCELPLIKGEEFFDHSDISRWARKYVYACKEVGLVNGRVQDGKIVFDAKNGATRAEVATILYNIEKIELYSTTVGV